MNDRTTPMERLLDICDRLRDEGGCPWDRKQTRESLRPFVLEEAYEVVEAIDEGDAAHLREELGDLLFQVVFHARIGREQGDFDFDAVADGITEKLIRRHPHVFGEGDRASDAEDAYKRWEQIKAEERKDANDGQPRSAIAGVPSALPALLKAQRTQEKAARVGFDWRSIEGVWEKLDEELGELREAAESGDRAHIDHELGDLLFSVVNLARFLETSAEDTLREATARFGKRFVKVEAQATDLDRALSDMTLEELEELWRKAKAQTDA